MAETKGFDPKDEVFEGDDEDFLAKLKNWHNAAKDNRQKFDWKWFIYRSFHKGDQYIQFNNNTNTIETPPRPAGSVRLVVNKIQPILRSIRNFVTGYRPVWSVVANSTNEEELNSGEKSAELLDAYYDRLDMPRHIKTAANLTGESGISFFQYAWDPDAVGMDDQMGECAVWTRDGFDVYMDPFGMLTGDLQNCRFIDIAVTRSLQDILNNPNYKLGADEKEDIGGDTERAASTFKEILIMKEYLQSSNGEAELETKILHETYYKKWVKQKDGTSDSEIWIASWIDGHLLRNEKTNQTKYQIIPVPSDNNSGEIYGEGFVKNLIPLQKTLNRLESQAVEYNNLVNRGRYIADTDAEVSKITNRTGEIITRKPGSSVEFWNPTGLASDLYRQIDRVIEYMDEISGVKEAFRGSAPAGVKSGVALESLKQQSANNLQDFRDNMEYALSQLGEGILETVANNVLVSRQVRAPDEAGKMAGFNFKGQVGATPGEELPENTYVIGNQNKVKVVIGSGLGLTKEGREARLDKMFEMKAIAPATYLRSIKFGDVDGAIKDGIQYQMTQSLITSQGAPAGPMPPAAPPPVDNSPDSWEKLAEDENREMLLGKVIPPTEGAPVDHTKVHIAWSQSDEVQGHEHLMKAVLEHIKGEEALQGAPQAAAPVAAPVA